MARTVPPQIVTGNDLEREFALECGGRGHHATGGFVDAAGGGGWGPVVTTTLLSSKMEPRKVIGTVNATEFFINLASAISLFLLVKITDWEALAGLILGGFLIAPFIAKVTRKISIKLILIIVGLLITFLSLRKLFLFFI